MAFEDSFKWNRTLLGMEKAELMGALAHEGGKYLYLGKPVIGRDKPVIGGIYIGRSMNRESIKVDDGPALNSLYEQAKSKATINGNVRPGLVLQSVYYSVYNSMPHGNLDNIKSKLLSSGIGANGCASLDFFIENGMGICRHLALTCAALLEKFKADGHIRGNASVDRCSDVSRKASHGWCRYTADSGNVHILDVGMGYLGSPVSEDAPWHYSRPEEWK